MRRDCITNSSSRQEMRIERARNERSTFAAQDGIFQSAVGLAWPKKQGQVTTDQQKNMWWNAPAKFSIRLERMDPVRE